MKNARGLDLANPEELSACIMDWHDDPRLMVIENFGMKDDGEGGRELDPFFTIDPWQDDVLAHLPRKDSPLSAQHGWQSKVRIAMKACAGPGKSAVLAWVGWWFMTVFAEPGKHPKGSAISINADNLKDNLWAEMSKWRHRSPLLMMMFNQTAERISCVDHPETWFLAAKSYKKDANVDEQGRTLSGQHSEFVLYLIDESGDINPAILRAAEQGMSNCEVGLIIQAGNTTSHAGMLYQAATAQRERWYVVSITADPDDPNRTTRVDIEWARDVIKTYGRDNPWVMAYVLGLFPPGAINALISVDEVERAMNRILKLTDFEMVAKRTGTDVARFGDDMTVIFPRQGNQAFNPVVMRNAASNEVGDRLFSGSYKFGSEMDFVDGTGGYGAGVVDHCRMLGMTVYEVQFSGKPLDARFFNKRSEIWWNMCEWIKRGGALPRISGLVKELTSVTYIFQNGKIRVEEKDIIKKRIGRSPDYGDALACSFAIPDSPANFTRMRGPQSRGHHGLQGYDMYAEDNGSHNVKYDPMAPERMI